MFLIFSYNLLIACSVFFSELFRTTEGPNFPHPSSYVVKERRPGEPRKLLFFMVYAGSHYKNQKELIEWFAD